VYFYLSKTLGLLLIPSNIFLVVVICGLLLWRSRYARLGRRLTVAGIVLLLIAGATPLGTALLVPLENRFPQWDASKGAPDGIVVLGGVINTHTSLARNDISLGPSAERLIAAVDLFRQYPATRIVFSGGNSNLISAGIPESKLVVRFLMRSGIPSDRIVVDRTARNTMENAINAKELAAPKSGERWLLVTSAFHMPRAIGLFRAAGFSVEAYPVDWKTGGWRDLRRLPSLPIELYQFNLAAHEWEGLFIDWITRRTTTLFPGPGDADSSRL
jgi:uncharacterized SAM-binding protein YcdF (DUF218 family)